MHCSQHCADLVLWYVLDISIRERANKYTIGDYSCFKLTPLVTIPAGILFAAERSRGLRLVVAPSGRQSARSRDRGSTSQNIATSDFVHEVFSLLTRAVKNTAPPRLYLSR